MKGLSLMIFYFIINFVILYVRSDVIDFYFKRDLNVVKCFICFVIN